MEKTKILLIDDDKFLLAMYKKKFEQTGKFDVITIEILDDDYVTQIANLKPDLIISDLVRPGPDGLEILRTLKLNRRTKNIPFIFLSNTMKPGLLSEGEENNVAGIISKGATIPQEVVDIVSTIWTNYNFDSSKYKMTVFPPTLGTDESKKGDNFDFNQLSLDSTINEPLPIHNRESIFYNIFIFIVWIIFVLGILWLIKVLGPLWIIALILLVILIVLMNK